LFVLDEGSLLKIEDLHIEYKGKEKFMFQGRRSNPDNVILENVTVARATTRSPAPLKPTSSVSDPVSVDQLIQFLKEYLESYRSEYQKLPAEPPSGAGYPKAFGNKAYTESNTFEHIFFEMASLLQMSLTHPLRKDTNLTPPLKPSLPYAD
jgi:hypothetical protein